MGEAKLNETLRAMRAAGHPCVYCGASSGTIEHMPPRAMFRQKDRPKGLEFPACSECQNATRLTDLVAAFACRFWPATNSEMFVDEFRSLLPKLRRNVPGLLEEMKLGRAGQKLAARRIGMELREEGLLSAGGPLFMKHMLHFAGKMGFAIYHEAKGHPVPADGVLVADFYTNAHAIGGQLPSEIIDLLPAPMTLSQGRKIVSDQFEYTWRETPCGTAFYSFASFGHSIAVDAIVYNEKTEAPIDKLRFPKTALVWAASNPDFATIQQFRPAPSE